MANLFWRQLYATVERTILIKRRTKQHLFFEIFMPLYFIAILAMIQHFLPDNIINATNKTETVGSLLPLHLPNSFAVVPNSSYVKSFVDNMANVAGYELHPIYFHDEKTMIQTYAENSSIFSSAIILQENPIRNGSYVIYFPTMKLPNLAERLGKPGECRPKEVLLCPATKYYINGFIQLQTLIESTFIKMITKTVSPIPTMTLKVLPKPEAILNTEIKRLLLPLYMVIAFSPFVSYVVIAIVSEKEKKIHESMKMMGLYSTVYWLSWFLVYGAFVLFLSLLTSILLSVTKIMFLSNVFIIFCSLFLYGLSIISMAFMVTPFFNNAKVAGAVCNVITTVFSCLYYLAVFVTSVNPAIFWVMSLISPTALALGLDIAIHNELLGVGLSFNNIWDGKFPFAATLIMLIVDIVLYTLLALYFDSVVPGEYGQKRVPWFCLLPSYWYNSKRNSSISSLLDDNSVENTSAVHQESVPIEFQGKEAIRLKYLKKVFKGKEKDDVIAVNGINMEIFEGQITALLGHNGAGKTTLINMLLGMIPATEGEIHIFGLDVSNYEDLSKVRQMTGICPQDNILFENLTPSEHLRFYAKIKGVSLSEVEQEIDRILREVDLSEKENTKAKNLSGGQKRKLSLGIALVGNPKIIILDEPTTGVDPYSRRHLWSLLQSIKADKVILLTTHHMDEADILADRKAILLKGCLFCIGSSLFIKNKFGLGYHLILSVNDIHNEERIFSFIHSHVPSAIRIPSRGQELVYVLPLKVVPQFPALLTAIDDIIQNSANDFGIIGYGISMSSLEEVFLKLGEEGGEKILDTNETVVHHMMRNRSLSGGDRLSTFDFQSNLAETDTTDKTKAETLSFKTVNTDQNPDFQAFKAILKIRFLNDLRLPKNIFSVIILPIVMICISLYMLNIQGSPNSSLTLNIEPNLYQTADGNPPLLYHSDHQDKDVNTFMNNINKLGVKTSEFNKSVETLLEDAPHVFFLWIKSLNFDTQKISATAAYNDTDLHSLPTLMNILNNARLPSSVIDSQFPFLRLAIKTFPLATLQPSFNGLIFGSTMMMGLIFTSTPINLVVDVIEDKEKKIKHLLRVNGISFFIYWSSFFCCHFLLMAVSLLTMIIAALAFKISLFMSPAPAICLILTYLLYIPAGLFFFYFFSFLFKKHDQAQSVLSFFPLILGFVPYLIVSLVDGLNPSNTLGSTLHYIFCFIFPLYPPYANLYFINKVYLIHQLLGMEPTFNDYFNTEIVVTLIAMILEIGFYCFLIRICDMNGNLKLFSSKKDTTYMLSPSSNEEADKDSDVMAECSYVKSLSNSDGAEIPLLIHSLCKEYINTESTTNCWKRMRDATSSDVDRIKSEKKAAVKNLYLAVQKDDIFGLLGPNGAGKTTTLKMVVIDEKPTSGKITVHGHDVMLESNQVYQSVGYCPQFDALWKNITLQEHLYCYAAIRGISSEQIPHLIDMYMNGLGITEHASKKSKVLSGGTKRKVSFAISMLGNSCIVLLDEPSAGMDPQSKRFLWNVIASSFHDSDRGAVLTTHSMEEADALCTRIGIMIKGELKCLGSSQHLKNKYGDGYLLEIQLSFDKSTKECFEELERFIKNLFPSYVIQEKFGSFIKCHIPLTCIGSLAKVFQDLESAKSRLGIVYYSFSQSSLDQVFLEFAKLQENDE